MGNPAAEKSEEATPRRKGKEREKGNIARSQDLNSAIILTVGIGILGILSSHILLDIQSLLQDTLSHLNPRDISTDDITLTLAPFVTALMKILMPFLIPLALIGVLILRLEVGNVFALDKIKFNLENIAPSKILDSAKKTLNPVERKNLVEFVKSFIKLVIVFLCGYTVINGRKDELYSLFGMNVETSFVIIGSILTQMLVNMCLAMLAIGLLDKKYQEFEYNKSLKMSKQEVKDEMKDIDGDPQIKAKIRSAQMRMARNRMMSNVAKADVVVTNPTHYAIALEYNKLKNPAPKVVAKGVDFVAFKIREIAQNNKVPIVENAPLARALYKLVPIDGIIPSDMFVAVAEVLAYVYNKNKPGGNK